MYKLLKTVVEINNFLFILVNEYYVQCIYLLLLSTGLT